MRRLSAQLSTAGWHTDEMENWRDCGWSISCTRGSSQLCARKGDISKRDGPVKHPEVDFLS